MPANRTYCLLPSKNYITITYFLRLSNLNIPEEYEVEKTHFASWSGGTVSGNVTYFILRQASDYAKASTDKQD